MNDALYISLPQDVIKVMDNWDLLKENQFLFDKDIFYYNVPVKGAFIQDDLGNCISLSVGDILELQQVIRETILIKPVDNDLLFYQLQYTGLEHQGLLLACDRNLKVYGFFVDKIAFTFNELYQHCGFKDFADKNGGFLGDYMTPSFASMTDLITSLKKGVLLSDYVYKKLVKEQPLLPYSNEPFIFPTKKPEHYIISTIQNQVGRII